MIFALPIVLGAIALTCTILTTFESPHLQGLTNAAISGVGSVSVTVYATRTLLDCLRPTNPRNSPSARTLFRHFSRWAAVAVPSVSNVVDELAPYSGPLSLAAANTLSASPTFASYVHTFSAKVTSAEAKARVWFGPRNHTLNLDPWFGWQPVYEGVGLAFCGDLYFPSTRLCYRVARASRVVRSLNAYRSDTKALVVYRQMPPTSACLPGDPPYYHRSMSVYGQGRKTVTTMNRVISIQPSLPIPLSHSGSGAVVSLNVYRPEMKNLAVYGQAAPLRKRIYTELSSTLLRVLSVMAAIYRQGIAILINLYPSRVELILACTLAFIGVCTQAIRTSRCHGLNDTEAVESSALAPNRRPYILVLHDNQPKEPKWWSLVPRFPLEDPHGQYDRDQGPEDDVSQIPASDSHGASMDLNVADNNQTGSVTALASGASDLNLAISTGPEVRIPSSHSDYCGGQLSGDSASSTTFASCDDTIPAGSPVANTSSPILTPNDLCSTEVTVEPQPTSNREVENRTNKPSPELGASTGSATGSSADQNVSWSSVNTSLDFVLDSAGQAATETITASNQGIGGTLEEPSIQDTSRHIGVGIGECLDESRMLPGNQPLDASTVDEILADGSNVDVDTSADMSLSSEALVGLGHVKQESLADELARAGPTEDGYVDSGLTIATLLDELTHSDSDMSNTDASTQENNSARPPNPSQVVAPAPADDIQHNFSLNMSVDMSLETDAGTEDTPVDTPKTDGGEVDVSAGDEAGHTTTAPGSSSLSLFPSISSSEMITNERADAFFADMATDSFASSREGLSTTSEEDSGQVTPTATELLAEESLDLTTDMSLGSQLLDVDLATLGDSTNSLDSALDGPAAPKVEPRDLANDSDLEIPGPRHGAPLSASVHAPSSTRLASALATVTEENPPEDQPDHLQAAGAETPGGEEHPTPGPGGLTRLRVPSKSYNAALSGLAHPPIMASPSLPLFTSPSPHASSLLVPSASHVGMSHDQDESVQEIGHLPGGSSASMWAPVGEDATSEDATGGDATDGDDTGEDSADEDAAGQGAAGEDAVGESAAGEGMGETAGPRRRKRRSKACILGRQKRHEEFIQKKQEEEEEEEEEKKKKRRRRRRRTNRSANHV
ncbi:hypothetical protein FRC09_001236 [Ceratobasidium sp. 395]|nr:hypothetical protein FRC09_001236 [Ceratobasidium sp. 395]